MPEPETLRSRLAHKPIVVAPGVYDPFTSLVATQAGFETLYVSGAAIAYTRLGRPDIGLVSMTEVTETLALIRDRVSAHLIVDGDTGYGNALNVVRTIREFERAGATAIQLEDQDFPKRCGHLDGKALIPAQEMCGKIRAAVDARRSRETLIVARTDAVAVEGFDRAMERAHAFRDAGADIGFVEAPTTAEQIAAIGRLPYPQLANIVIGGKTPERSNNELKNLGFAGVLYANTALQAAVLGMQRALGHLKEHGQIGHADDILATFTERQRLVDIGSFQAMERKYK